MIRPFFAGIGSRKIIQLKPELKPVLAGITRCLVSEGYILRSGGAIGCDQWFELGAPDSKDKEIFYANKKIPNGADPKFYTVDSKAMELAESIHPKWGSMDVWGQGLHARNTYQILGRDHDAPVDFVICWTFNGIVEGGTRTAIVLAKNNSIPVLNLGSISDNSHVEAFETFMLSNGYNVNLSDFIS